jgi:hypothetical protein
VLIIFARLFSWPMTWSTAALIPRFRSMGLRPAATERRPSTRMALVSTVAVVVPSPATSLVADATCFTSDAPTFWYLSENSSALATVTPSLVIFGPRTAAQSRRCDPLGPIVTWTASARRSTPASTLLRQSTPNFISLAA